MGPALRRRRKVRRCAGTDGVDVTASAGGAVRGADVGDRRSEHGFILRPRAAADRPPRGASRYPRYTGDHPPPRPACRSGVVALRPAGWSTPHPDVRLDDGRTLRAYDARTDAGADDAFTIVWHHGSPQTGAPLDPLAADLLHRRTARDLHGRARLRRHRHEPAARAAAPGGAGVDGRDRRVARVAGRRRSTGSPPRRWRSPTRSPSFGRRPRARPPDPLLPAGALRFPRGPPADPRAAWGGRQAERLPGRQLGGAPP